LRPNDRQAIERKTGCFPKPPTAVLLPSGPKRPSVTIFLKKLLCPIFTFTADWKKPSKKDRIKLAGVEILCTFAPAFKAKFLYRHWKNNRKKSEKRFAGFGKGFYLCHPQNDGNFEIGRAEKIN